MANLDYLKFIENKKHSIGNFGFKANYIPDIAFDFQKYVIEKAIEKGRSAVFLDTGIYRDWETDRKSTRLNSSHSGESRMPSSA